MKILQFALLFMFSISQVQAQDTYCAKANGEGSFDNLDLSPTSGDPYIDYQTAVELRFMQTRFLVVPDMYFYDGENALSTKEVYSQMGPDGTIAFGKILFNRERLRDPTGPSISIIIAHEFGHIVQFKYGGFSNVSTMRRELFADYMAGAYLRVRGGLNTNAVYECFSEMGDYDFGNIDHHGTPAQRTAALRKGFRDANTYGNQFSLSRAISLGKSYVMGIEDPNVDEDPELKSDDDEEVSGEDE